jgi:Uma2 family endonuclease
MATVPTPLPRHDNGYPTSSKKPMPETDWHRDLMLILIEVLRAFFAGQRVYVSGNLLIFYEEGNRRRHISPDVFVVRGVENYQRPNYLIWEEARGPEVVIELTSSTTHREDTNRKMALYRDTLRVREYFLFDPDGDYLDPPLQGYRLRQGTYQRIRAVHGRLPSQVLGLHLEADGRNLRLWSPALGTWLPTPAERLHQEMQARQQEALARQDAEQRADSAEQRADSAEHRADTAEQRADTAERRAEKMAAELERLRQQLGLPPSSPE